MISFTFLLCNIESDDRKEQEVGHEGVGSGRGCPLLTGLRFLGRVCVSSQGKIFEVAKNYL